MIVNFSILIINCSAQPLQQRLQSAMNGKRVNNYYDGTTPFKNDAVKSGEELLQLLQPYAKDSIDGIRYFTCDMYMLIANSNKEHIAGKAVEEMAKMLADSVYSVRNNAAQQLAQVPLMNFTANAKQIIANSIFLNTKNLTEEQLRLCGYLHLTNLTSPLQVIATDRKNDKMIRWSAYLAMARMGNEDALNEVLRQVKNAGLNDDIVYSLLPDLVYTKQKPAFDYLVELLNNNELLCSSPNPDSDKRMVCGYRIMEMLAPEVRNFPLAVLPSGDIDTKDYPQALETARQWFSEHKDYEIVADRF